MRDCSYGTETQVTLEGSVHTTCHVKHPTHRRESQVSILLERITEVVDICFPALYLYTVTSNFSPARGIGVASRRIVDALQFKIHSNGAAAPSMPSVPFLPSFPLGDNTEMTQEDKERKKERETGSARRDFEKLLYSLDDRQIRR